MKGDRECVRVRAWARLERGKESDSGIRRMDMSQMGDDFSKSKKHFLSLSLSLFLSLSLMVETLPSSFFYFH